MDKAERDYEESITTFRGLLNGLIIAVCFWGLLITGAAAVIGALT